MPNQQPLLYPLKIASIYHWRQHSVPVLRVKKNIKKDMIFYTRSIPLTLALQNNFLSQLSFSDEEPKLGMKKEVGIYLWIKFPTN